MAHKFGLLVLVFLAGLLAACGQDEVVEEVVLVTETAVPPTNTPTTIPSPTTTYTPTPSPTQTAVPTKLPTATTATATTIPTLTPLPTFAPDELETAVADLLANPMNCDVPCWWGAIPGKTGVFEVQQFLALYQLTYYQRDDNAIPDYIELWKNENLFNFSARYSFEDHLLKTVYARQSPPLHEILKKYGQPDEIWLSTMSVERETLPVVLNIIYLQESMAVHYTVDGDIFQDTVLGCFANEMGNIRLNAPNSASSYKDFTLIFELDRRYLPLDGSTNLTMAEFMEQFSDPSQPQCLETPTELWD